MADDLPAGSEGTLERRETPDDKRKADAAEVKLWLDALALASKEEDNWRTDAAKVIQRYRGEKEYSEKRYRLLYSNVQTMAPALYNSVPIPDIRRRFGDRDEDAKQISQALERCLSCQAEKGDLDSVMEEMTLHRLLPGRSVTRIRHEREVIDGYTKESVVFEPIAWEDYRHGPAKRWEDVPWVAFRLFLTRDQVTALVKEADGDMGMAERIPLNASVSGVRKEGEGQQPPSVFKRAEVWQFWDKETKNLVYICPDFKDAPVAKVQDTLQLEGFFPNPRPMLALRSPDSLVPVVEYSQYAKLADDLEDVTVRLADLVATAKAVGLTAKELATAFASVASLKDGQLAASDEAFTLAQNGKIDDAIWFWPLDKIVIAIRELYLAREEIKKTIYEVSGLSDILRGDTNASETLGAQQIKAQWGSARLQRAQADVARFARDLFRLAVEIIATKFEPQSIMLASGVQLTPQQVQLMQRDVMREYRIDVESDSTIRADLTRHQENMGQFVQGLAALVTALGPVVQAGMMPGETAAALLTGFARNFKLGKQAEDALEKLGDDAQKPQQPKPPTPEQMSAEAQAAKDKEELRIKDATQQFSQELETRKQLFAEKQHADSLEQARQDTMANVQVETIKAGVERDRMLHERDMATHQANEARMEAERKRAIEDRDFNLRNDESMHKRRMDGAANDQAQTETDSKLASALAPALEQMAAAVQQQAEATAKLAEAAMAETELVRGPDGRPQGARKKPPQPMPMVM